MSSSNNRFGRRTGGQSDNLRSEPSLSFNPKRPGARGTQSDAEPSVTRTPPSTPRVGRADAAAFGARSGRDAQRDPIPSFMRGPSSMQSPEPGLRIERDDAEEFGVERHDEDFDPRRAPREKAMEPRIPAADRPLYHHLFDEEEKRGHGFGWAAALGSVVVIVVGAAYAWHNFMSRPAPGNLFDQPGIASRGPDTGYTTPTQPTDNADNGAGNGLDTGSTASTGTTPSPSTAVTPPDLSAPPTRDVAVAPQPKDVPAEPPPPPKKTISEAAANPGNLGPPVTSPPPSATQQAVAPAPVLTPPAPKHETPKREAPRKEAAITPPKPAPAPVQHDTAPPAVTQPAAAPAESAPPPRRHRLQATGQPQQLDRSAPTAYPEPAYPPSQQQPSQQQQQPSFATRSPPPTDVAPDNGGQNNASPQPGSPDTVTVDGVTYVNGQEPHSLGTLSDQPPAASDAPMPPAAPSSPAPSQPPSTRYYAPADHDGGAPLPNDVIILPNGQMAVPNGQQ
jgi:hypothetical protein